MVKLVVLSVCGSILDTEWESGYFDEGVAVDCHGFLLFRLGAVDAASVDSAMNRFGVVRTCDLELIGLYLFGVCGL